MTDREKMFFLLGLIYSTDVDARLVAQVFDLDEEQTRAAVDELMDALADSGVRFQPARLRLV